ncbi:transposase [Clostridium bowmanii]|uniref:transposase n=1 Tax=Clostridium bowmanii TaxID=132925 RepID=UPI001C0D5D82|nr:transposase [Clostridium bowmanii]MBU3191595.1 transposase [Clostridium bowmanii]MCA1072436.1 transposase [Clostridium bowmanii]
MARKAREKAEDAIFHIMCKSISELDLFRDEDDKRKYLLLVKKYKELYNFKVYGYCIMDNHLHLLIDTNGSDISKVMHGINFSYAIYYNKKYKRDGHLFKDRFKSKIVNNKRYLRTVSLYIHNNPIDIAGYRTCPEKYAFSSLEIFLGKRRDYYKLVDYVFVMSLFGNNLKSARKNYYNLIFKCNEEKLKEEIEFEDEKTDYKMGRKLLKRNFKVEDILEFVTTKMNISRDMINIKYNRNIVETKALIIVLMRSLCNFKSSDICKVLGNVSHSRVSKLSTIGIGFIGIKEKHENIIEDFIKYNQS